MCESYHFFCIHYVNYAGTGFDACAMGRDAYSFFCMVKIILVGSEHVHAPAAHRTETSRHTTKHRTCLCVRCSCARACKTIVSCQLNSNASHFTYALRQFFFFFNIPFGALSVTMFVVLASYCTLRSLNISHTNKRNKIVRC